MLKTSHLAALAVSWLVSATSVVQAETGPNSGPDSEKLVALAVVPAEATLSGKGVSRRFVLIGTYADGFTRDLTPRGTWTLSDPAVGDLPTGGTLTARSTGNVTLTARLAGRTATSTVRVKVSDAERPFSFRRDIGAILTKQGCNTTDCHGTVKGKGGLKLSANALDAREDYGWIVEGGTFQVLTAESKGPKTPRIDQKNPEQSLILTKPTMLIEHGGGQRFDVGSADYRAILAWIRNGAPYGADTGGAAAVVKVDVFPPELVLEMSGQHQLLVTAHLADGSTEDLSDQVMYVPTDSQIIDVSDSGVVKPLKPGETSVLIRAAGFAVSTRVGVVRSAVADYPEVESWNFIDRFIFAKLRKFNIVPSELSSDAEFLRRICLDLAGTLPPPERVREFLASTEPNKRNQLIETLLQSPEYVDYWGFLFSDLMRATFVTSNNAEMTKAYEDWVVNSIAANKPYDQMAREKIAATGFSAPARNLQYVGEPLPPEQLMAEHIRIFWGKRLDCAQCHNHPFEIWTQNQFWGLVAYYGGLEELRGSKVFFDRLDRDWGKPVAHPRSREKVSPTFVDGTPLPANEQLSPRARLAEQIIASPDFAETAVNRIWGYLFGRAIVAPVDDFRATNPPTHPELLDALARDFRARGHDLKQLIRTIVQSRTYQLSGASNDTNRGDKLNYSRALPRPMEAAVLLDAISSVTGIDEHFKYHPMAGGPDRVPAPGTRAIQMNPDLCPSQFMDVYGRSMRKQAPLGPPEPTLAQALHMWAGPTYTAKIAEKGGRLDKLLAKEASDAAIIDDFYLAALTRPPTNEEQSQLLGFLAGRQERREQTLQGFVWALLCSGEFATNH
ncbi:MAG: DUF1549 domain-containing protein [Planctomycetales bacterium]